MNITTPDIRKNGSDKRGHDMYKWLAILLVVLGIVFAITAVSLLPERIHLHPAADYGVLVGGVTGILFSLAGLFLLLQNLNDQAKNFVKSQIESRFVELVRIQRQNSSEIAIKDKEGKKIFITLLRELYLCIEVVEGLKARHQIGDEDILNLGYLAFFYGAIGPLSEEIITNKIAKTRYPHLAPELIKAFKEKRKTIARNKFSYLIFDGHQSQLGNYFRHLYQSVSYMNEAQYFKYPEKYASVKMLRAQLSTQEQILLFFNSISTLGQAWELDEKIKDDNGKLITKYNLLTNIPQGFVRFADPRAIYAGITFEGMGKSDARRKLEKRYK